MNSQTYHSPVLPEEAIRLLNVKEGGVYADATFGGGGHSGRILQKIGDGKLFAFDKDPDAAANIPSDARFTLIPSDFRHIRESLEAQGIFQINGILADLGISSHQVDDPERGFSFRYDAPLDMRMDTTQELTAAEVVNDWPEAELWKVFTRYGEIPSPSRFLKNLIRARKLAAIRTTKELSEIAVQTAPREKQKKYLAQVFQALRIVVNGELDALADLLSDAGTLLSPGGRLVIISYHSLEDRMVKNFFRYGNLERKDERDLFGNPLSGWKVLTTKAIKPSDEEIEENPRARSARLRAAERL